MLSGYPDWPSATVGGNLRFHAAVTGTNSAVTFRAHFFRHGAAFTHVGSSPTLTAYPAQIGRPDQDWGWPTYDFPVPPKWQPGVYLVWLVPHPSKVTPRGQSALSIARDPSAFLCVLRDTAPGTSACILYKLPLFTYQAYNDLGTPAGCLYTGGFNTVTLHRPGGGIGGHAWDDFYPDVYDNSSSRQIFAHWDLPMIQWLESAGYAVDYCTDLDLHSDDGTLLTPYRLLLSVGHDEYWSPELRGRIQTFVANGGNVAFFSGNTCWWRVHGREGNTAIFCDKSGASGAFDQWYATQPENAITGVSYRNAGGSWAGPRQLVGYTVQYANHWVYANTGLSDGAAFGAPLALVGYECDGAALSPVPGPLGYAIPSYADGTPSNFIALGIGRLDGSWNDRPSGDAAAATMGVYTQGGTVFTAATTDWARALASGDPAVVQITRNVLDKLGSMSIRIRGLSTAACAPVAVEGGRMRFTADTSKLPQQSNLTYTWTSTTPAGPASQPTFEVTLPSPPAPVTITVTVSDGTNCPAFGTLTFTPLTRADAARLELMCLLRNLVIGSAVSHKALQGVRDRARWWVDPLWDPIRGELTVPFLETTAQIRAAQATLREISKRLERMPASTAALAKKGVARTRAAGNAEGKSAPPRRRR